MTDSKALTGDKADVIWWYRDYPGKTTFVCEHCQKEIRRYTNNPDANRFCSRKCYWDSRRRWKVGCDGYVRQTFNHRDTRQHQLIAEKALGRRLKLGECVHHINGDKADNRNQNLLICTLGYHRWLHERMAQLYMKEHFRIGREN